MKFNDLVFWGLLLLVLSACSPRIYKIACIGDSITEGSGLAVQSKTAFPVVLDSILGPKFTVLNCGRSATTMQKNGNFPFWISKEFSNTFAFRPDIIVIKLGTNDTKLQNWNPQNFELDYQSMIDTLATISTHPKIFMCLPVPVFKTNWGINDSTLTNGVIPILERLAKKNKLQLIDLYQPMTIEIVNFPDFIHPNEIAVKKMAKLIAAAIQPK
ncbi:MAG: hypothetical protein RIS47_1945 [Bacteroidota bacterium]